MGGREKEKEGERGSGGSERSRGEEGTTASASVLRRGRGPDDERVVPDYRARDGASAGPDAVDTGWRLLVSARPVPIREGATTLKILSGKREKSGAPIFANLLDAIRFNC